MSRAERPVEPENVADRGAPEEAGSFLFVVLIAAVIAAVAYSGYWLLQWGAS